MFIQKRQTASIYCVSILVFVELALDEPEARVIVAKLEVSILVFVELALDA